METFDFPYHQLEHEYPESSTAVQFGRGYRFVTRPIAPDQVIYKLRFPALWWYKDAYGNIDPYKNPQLNIECLRQFYHRHRLYEKFYYIHPVDGRQVVRFLEPLRIPVAVPDGNGLVRNLELKLILEP